MDFSNEKLESMNPKDLSFTHLDSKPNCSDPTCPVPTEFTAHTEFHQNSSTEKEESTNPSDLCSTQIDGKFNFRDLKCPDPTETASLVEQDELDLTAHKTFFENSFTEKHESMNPQDFSFSQIDSKVNSSDSRCPVPTKTDSSIEQSQLDTAHTEFHQLCLPRKPQIIPSVSRIFVSNTYEVADVTLLMPKSRTETSGDRSPRPPNVWQNGTSLRPMRVLGPVFAVLFAVYWGWSCLYASEQQ